MATRPITAIGYMAMRWNQHNSQGTKSATSEKWRLPATAAPATTAQSFTASAAIAARQGERADEHGRVGQQDQRGEVADEGASMSFIHAQSVGRDTRFNGSQVPIRSVVAPAGPGQPSGHPGR